MRRDSARRRADTVSVIPYERRYRNEVRDLIYGSYRSHSHLDWHDTDYWLDRMEAPIRLAHIEGRLVGVMAMSEPLSAMSWLRLAAIADDMQPAPVLMALWADLQPELEALGVVQVDILILRDWIVRHLPEMGFHYEEDIVTLRRVVQPLVDVPLDVEVRISQPQDLTQIAEIDMLAFTPPWQLSLFELRQADRVAAISTVAVQGAQVVGYQLTTLHLESAHLARLAVHPEAQSHGVGAALMHDLLTRVTRRGIRAMTVNTQLSNERSQHLYQRFGFERNGYDLPVWATRLPLVLPKDDVT
jgi:ribosomal protein S18 acetylase RimI-like enzyme